MGPVKNRALEPPYRFLQGVLGHDPFCRWFRLHPIILARPVQGSVKVQRFAYLQRHECIIRE